jgi:hypothetical protein
MVILPNDQRNTSRGCKSARDDQERLPNEATGFLEQLRPSGPWILTAITPDGPTETITARTAAEIDAFVKNHDGKRNLYYSVNPTKTEVIKKAAKTDIAAIEYLLGDLDPKGDETPEDAKARYLGQLNRSFEPKPTAIIDSGNGIQCLWRLTDRIALGSPIKTTDASGKTVLAFSPEDKAKVDDAERRAEAIMLRLGAKAGTQNIDRILRLPGTTNLPNEKKRKEGRVACPTRLIAFNGASYPLDAFPADGAGAEAAAPEQPRGPIDVDVLPISDRIKDLIRGVDDPEHMYGSRSERVFAVIMAMVGANCPHQQVQDVMFERHFAIGDHVREQPNPVDYLARQIRHALAKLGGPEAAKREIKIKARMDDILKSAADLQMKTFEPLRLIVPNYLPEGLTLLGGRPKIGKSWLALDTAVGVSSGGSCLGEKCEQGDVLALMLEDSDRRLQRRLTQMLGAQKGEWPGRLQYATSWPRLNDGGLDWIRDWIDRVKRPRLVIVDILEQVRQRTSTADKRTAYSADYDALIKLHELATEAMISILVLHHQRKLGADDLIDTVSGTLGLGGAVDSVLILAKEQNKDAKFLWGRGRDLEEFSVTAEQNEKCRWDVGPRNEAQASPERDQIISVLAKAGRPLHVKEIAEACRNKENNVRQLLFKMSREGSVDRVAQGVYKTTDPQEQIPF